MQLAFQRISTPRLLRNQKLSRSFITILAGAPVIVFCPLFGQLTIGYSEPTHDAVGLYILLLPEAMKLVPFGNIECDCSLIRRILHGLKALTASLCYAITFKKNVMQSNEEEL